MSAKDYPSARAQLTRCLELQPKNPTTHFLAAQAARRDNDLDAAEQHLLACQDLEDVVDDVTLEWALVLAQRGKLSDVEEYLRRRLAEHSASSVPILEVLSWQYIKLHRLGDAKQLVNAWLKEEPSNHEPWVRMGWIAEHLFDHAGALEAYEKALEVKPDQDNVRLRLAEIQLQRNKPAEALPYFQQIQEAKRSDPEFVVAYARCQRLLGKFAEADALLQDLLATHPHHSQALSERGLVALADNKPDDAEKLLREAIRYGPQDRQVLFNLYQCLEQLDKKEEAATVKAKLKEMEADLKRMDGVMQEVQRRPHDPAPRCEAGRIFLRNGFTQDGLHWLSTALLEDPTHRLTHQTLADYYEQAGDSNQAALHRSFVEKK